MSMSYYLMCEDCGAELSVGQGWHKHDSHMYVTTNEPEKARDQIATLWGWLFDHEGHKLKFGDENADYPGRYDDENPRGGEIDLLHGLLNDKPMARVCGGSKRILGSYHPCPGCKDCL